MAEGIMKNILKQVEGNEIPRGEYEVESRGIFAVDGDKASENSIIVMNSMFGIDVSSHRAKRLTEKDVAESQLILTMTQAHKSAIIASFPQAENKVFTLKEYAAMEGKNVRTGWHAISSLDIRDPYGGSLEDYRECAAEINEAVKKVIDKLIKSKKIADEENI